MVERNFQIAWSSPDKESHPILRGETSVGVAYLRSSYEYPDFTSILQYYLVRDFPLYYYGKFSGSERSEECRIASPNFLEVREWLEKLLCGCLSYSQDNSDIQENKLGEKNG